MKAGLNKIKIAIISMIVLAMAIGQLELFGKVYAEELEKIKEQDHYYTEFGIIVTMPKKKLYRSFDNGIGKTSHSSV